MLRLSFRQTQAELMVRAAATLVFSVLEKSDCPITTVSELTTGSQYGYTASAVLEEVGPNFVRITDLQDGGIDWATVPYCNCSQPDKYLLATGDILFARTGATTGKTYLVKECPVAVFASYLIRLRPRQSVRADYLYSFFQSNNYWTQILDEKEGSAQPNVNAKKLMQINMPVVDMQTQTAISRFLEIVRSRQDGIHIALPELPDVLSQVPASFARIEAIARRVEEARALRQKAVEEAEAFLPSGLDELFKNLSGKHAGRRIEEVCDVVRGGSPRPAGDPLYYGGTIPFIKVGDITKDDDKFLYSAESTVNDLGKNHSRFISAGTLMLTNSGATLGVPKITMLDACFNDGSQAFLNLNKDVFIEYLYYFLKSKTRWFRESPARGQGQPNLNTDMVRPMEFPCPPLAEQRRIVAYLDGLQAKVDELKRLQAQTQKELDALMPSVLAKAFAGEL